MLPTTTIMENVKKMYYELEEQLQFVHLEIRDVVKNTETSMEIIINALQKLKNYIIKYKFRNEQEEIKFFKEEKPLFLSKLIYFNAIYKIEIRKPHGSDISKRKYIAHELDKLKQFFDNNLDFYRYYRTGSTYLDHKYFLRGKHDIKLSLDTFCFEADHRFSTSHDYNVAKILANDLLQVYLEDQLAYIDKKEPREKAQDFPRTKLSWTESKTALIELIYGLHIQKVFDAGKADIKLIADYFESIFNIDLGDYYHTYLELRMRKTGKTKFLTSLVENLNKKMDEQDEK